jgi:hypothetical protein
MTELDQSPMAWVNRIEVSNHPDGGTLVRVTIPTA